MRVIFYNCKIKMDRIYTFLEFANEKKFNKKIMDIWTNIFDGKVIDIPITENILFLLDEKYSTIKNFRKLLKLNNITYTKLNNHISLTDKNFKYLLMSHGSTDVKIFLMNLPYIVRQYDEYLIEKRIEISKSYSR